MKQRWPRCLPAPPGYYAVTRIANGSAAGHVAQGEGRKGRDLAQGAAVAGAFIDAKLRLAGFMTFLPES